MRITNDKSCIGSNMLKIFTVRLYLISSRTRFATPSLTFGVFVNTSKRFEPGNIILSGFKYSFQQTQLDMICRKTGR